MHACIWLRALGYARLPAHGCFRGYKISTAVEFCIMRLPTHELDICDVTSIKRRKKSVDRKGNTIDNIRALY